MADMMMSERPSNGGSLGGGASAGVSIGNYKGVMLCNRPFGGVAAAAHKAISGGDGNVPFRSAVIPHEPLGLNPSRERRAMIRVDRKKKNSALSRHKKWLKQLQKAKEQFQEQAIIEENAKEERRKKFAAQQAALRAEVRNTVEDAVDEVDALEMAATKLAEAEEINDRAIEAEMRKLNMYEQKNQEENEGKEEQILGKAQLKRANNNKSKPAWALTEDQKDQLEDEEADDLMDFANNLDVDKYLDDLEVRAALESVRQRIQELDNEEEEEEDADLENNAENDYGSKYEEKDSNENQKPRKKRVKKVKLTKESLNALIGENDEGKKQDDDARSIASHASARSVLSDVKSLRGIHSARSLAQLAKQTAKEMGKNGAGPLAAIPEKPFIPPKISVVDEKKGIREEIKDRASGLPYLHRNPAI
jgi:hypothetical protein